MKANHTRLDWIDQARGLAILAVLVCHLDLIPSATFNSLLHSFQIPLFVVVSGYLLRQRTPAQLVQLARRLLAPYILTGILSLALWQLWLRQTPIYSPFITTWQSDLEALFLARSLIFNGPLWFLPILFISLFMANAFFFHNALVRLPPRHLLIFAGVFWTLGFFATLWFSLGSAFSPDLVLLFLGYLAFGTWLQQSSFLLKISLQQCALLAILFVSGAVLNRNVDFFSRSFQQPLIYLLVSLTGSLFFLRACQLLQNQTGILLESVMKFLRFLGRNSLLILVTHWPVFMTLNVLAFHFFHDRGITFSLTSLLAPQEQLALITIIKIGYFTVFYAGIKAFTLATSSSRVRSVFTK